MEKNELKTKEDEMHDLLMQSFIEKLEGMELLLHAALDQRPQVDLSPILNEILGLKKEIVSSYSKPGIDKNLLIEINQNLSKLQHRLSTLENNKIAYKHVLHKGIWISIGLSLAIILLIVGWSNTYTRLRVYKENDIKYRYLKVFANDGFLKQLVKIDSLYRIDNDGFFQKVSTAESELGVIADSISLSVHRIQKNRNKSRN